MAERRIVIEIEQMRRHGAGEMSESGHMLQRRRDLGSAAKTMPHHAGDPGRIGGARADDAGDLLGQRARVRLLGTGRIEVIERRSCRAEMSCRRRNAGLMRGIVGGEQEIGFRQVLKMDKGVGGNEPRLDAGAIVLHPAIRRERPG